MSNRDYVTGHIKDPEPLIEKRRASCPGAKEPAKGYSFFMFLSAYTLKIHHTTSSHRSE